MRTRITEALIRQIPPVPRTVFVRDDRLIGFALRVTPGGAKSFIAESRVSGRMRRFTIGAASRFTVDEARTAARALLADMSSGKDPQTKRRAARSRSDTLAAMLDAYIAAQNVKPSTAPCGTAVMFERPTCFSARALLSPPSPTAGRHRPSHRSNPGVRQDPSGESRGQRGHAVVQ
jgi:hypothetical protein